jgi:hypothetical protein
MATAFRYFPGKSIEWLKARHDALLEQIATAMQPTGATVGDVSTSGAPAQSVQTSARQLYHDMSVLDPATYPPRHVPRKISRGAFVAS